MSFDRALGVIAVVLLAPALAARAALAKHRVGRVFESYERLGVNGRPITIRAFAGSHFGRRLGYVFALASGDVRLIGPHPLHPDDYLGRSRRDHSVWPGLLSRRRLRARTGIDHDGDESMPGQFPLRPTNLALVARYVITQTLAGRSLRETPERFELLGVEVDNGTMNDTLDWAVAQTRAARKVMLAFVNPDCLNQALDNAHYREILQRVDRVVPDGIGIKVATGFQGVEVRENVNGTDMFPLLCQRAVRDDLSLYLLGARPGVAQAAAETMQKRFEGLRIAGIGHGYFAPEEEARVVADINASRADILLVALGVPRQEIWLDRHRAELSTSVVLGVGGLFDFYSGRIQRAPGWVRDVGMEWAWRLGCEPGRMWRRYVIGNPRFLLRAWREARRRGDSPRHRPSRPLLGFGYYEPEEPPGRP